jgi:hypothetical protein
MDEVLRHALTIGDNRSLFHEPVEAAQQPVIFETPKPVADEIRTH